MRFKLPKSFLKLCLNDRIQLGGGDLEFLLPLTTSIQEAVEFLDSILAKKSFCFSLLCMEDSNLILI